MSSAFVFLAISPRINIVETPHRRFDSVTFRLWIGRERRRQIDVSPPFSFSRGYPYMRTFERGGGASLSHHNLNYITSSFHILHILQHPTLHSTPPIPNKVQKNTPSPTHITGNDNADITLTLNSSLRSRRHRMQRSIPMSWYILFQLFRSVAYGTTSYVYLPKCFGRRGHHRVTG